MSAVETTFQDYSQRYSRTSPFAEFVFQTDATELRVTSYNNIYGTYPQFTSFGIYVDGAFHSRVLPGAAGVTHKVIALSAGSKRVALVNGLQSRPNSGAPSIGTFVTAVSANAPLVYAPELSADRLVIYGDSIAVGGNATAEVQEAWVMRVRASRYPDSTIVEGWGYRSLYEDYTEGLGGLVGKLLSVRPARIWLSIGTNDYGLNKWSAGDFGAVYATLLDDLHAALPDAAIYCQTPLVRSNEAANASGSTLGDYRTQIGTAAAGRAYCTVVDGTQILTTADLDDGVHPTSNGHALYATYANGVLGG